MDEGPPQRRTSGSAAQRVFASILKESPGDVPTHRSLRALSRGLKQERVLSELEQGIRCRFFAVLNQRVYSTQVRAVVSNGSLAVVSRGGPRNLLLSSKHKVVATPDSAEFLNANNLDWVDARDKAALLYTVTLVRPQAAGEAHCYPYVFSFDKKHDRRVFAKSMALLLTYYDVYVPPEIQQARLNAHQTKVLG